MSVSLFAAHREDERMWTVVSVLAFLSVGQDLEARSLAEAIAKARSEAVACEFRYSVRFPSAKGGPGSFDRGVFGTTADGTHYFRVDAKEQSPAHFLVIEGQRISRLWELEDRLHVQVERLDFLGIGGWIGPRAEGHWWGDRSWDEVLRSAEKVLAVEEVLESVVVDGEECLVPCARVLFLDRGDRPVRVKFAPSLAFQALEVTSFASKAPAPELESIEIEGAPWWPRSRRRVQEIGQVPDVGPRTLRGTAEVYLGGVRYEQEYRVDVESFVVEPPVPELEILEHPPAGTTIDDLVEQGFWRVGSDGRRVKRPKGG